MLWSSPSPFFFASWCVALCLDAPPCAFRFGNVDILSLPVKTGTVEIPHEPLSVVAEEARCCCSCCKICPMALRHTTAAVSWATVLTAGPIATDCISISISISIVLCLRLRPHPPSVSSRFLVAAVLKHFWCTTRSA